MRFVLLLSILFALVLPAWAVNTERNFGGVGIDGIPLPDGQIRVRQVVAGGPANQAGIRVGDIITHIDGAATRGGNFQTMVGKRLRGAAGTRVVLRIRREGSDTPLSLTLTRRQLVLNPIKEK